MSEHFRFFSFPVSMLCYLHTNEFLKQFSYRWVQVITLLGVESIGQCIVQRYRKCKVP